MAEFDPVPPKDATEVAYTQALLGDADTGREQRHARLMAALPRPEVAAAVPVSDNSLAWRWQPYVLGLMVTGLLVASALILKGRNTEPRSEPDPRLAAAPAASTAAVVVAQADAKVEALPVPVIEAPRAAAKASPARPRAELPAPIVVADATPPRQQREAEVSAAPAVVLSKPVMPSAPAAPVMAAAAPPPPAAMAATPPKVVAEAANQAEGLVRSEAVSSGVAARARVAPQAAFDAAEPAKANALLLAAVNQIDVAMARSALQAGASVHPRDVKGRTALMLAAQTGSREMVELLLAAGARKADRDSQGWTASDHARERGYDDLAERLR